jgi:hypothetical protein
MTDDRQHQQAARGNAMMSDAVGQTVAAGALQVGAHLITSRRGYSHHGIYVGAGKVVHYAGFSSGLHRGPVEEVTLAEFAAGRAVQVRAAEDVHYSAAEIAARARSRLGENRYRLTTNNCEHFCAWCVHGESRSEQVESIRSSPRQAMAFAIAMCRHFIAARAQRRVAATGMV